jgi:putative membrane protein (TIGR04086 family)
MRRTEPGRSQSRGQQIAVLALGALLALGIELIVIFLGSVAVSAGVLKAGAAAQTTAAACLIGCFIGGNLACKRWNSKRLFAGLLTGLLCFLFILIIACLMDGTPELGTQALVECAGCLVGGGIAGVLAGGKKKKTRKTR